MTFWDVLYKYYKHGGIAWTLLAVVLILLIWLIAHPEIVKEWNVLISTWIAGFVPRKRKKTFEKRLDLTVESAKTKLSEELPEYMEKFLPYKLKVEWVGEDDSIESVIDDKQIIVYVPSYKNEAQQVIGVLHSYCSTGFAEKAKLYMTESEKTATDLIVTQKLASHSGHSIFDYFNREYLPCFVKKDAKIAAEFERLKKIDTDGLFLPILINEIDKYANAIYPSIPSEETELAINKFVGFISTIVTKQKGEKVNLHFADGGINIAIILAVSDENQKIMNHVVIAETYIKNGVNTIYIIASGQKTS